MRSVGVLLLLVALSVPGAIAQELQQIVIQRSGPCDSQLHYDEVYENHGPGPIRVVRSRIFMGAPGPTSGAYIAGHNGFIMAFTTNHNGPIFDKDVIPSGTTHTVNPEEYLYLAYFCYAPGSTYSIWAFIEYVR